MTVLKTLGTENWPGADPGILDREFKFAGEVGVDLTILPILSKNS